MVNETQSGLSLVLHDFLDSNIQYIKSVNQGPHVMVVAIC